MADLITLFKLELCYWHNFAVYGCHILRKLFLFKQNVKSYYLKIVKSTPVLQLTTTSFSDRTSG